MRSLRWQLGMLSQQQNWLPKGHLAYFVSDVVDHLDLSAHEGLHDTVLQALTSIKSGGYSDTLLVESRREGFSRAYSKDVPLRIRTLEVLNVLGQRLRKRIS